MSLIYHSIVGLPRSGKTTYLAALWHLIDAGEVKTKLVLDKLIGDHEHLNKIVECWRRCEEVPRTSLAAEKHVSIHMHEPSTGKRIILGFADLSGESFESQFSARRCTQEYLERDESSSGGILLFINANRPNDGVTITDLGPLLEEEDNSLHADDEIEWSHSLVPQQVCLVDLLQFLQRPPFTRKLRKLAIAVSAWDVVAPGITPTAWVERELPFLSQFLKTNEDSFEVRTYGISAQGGNVTSEQRSELLRKTPSLRVACVENNTNSHDLTAPLVWLSGGD